jgi:hypothetical protein
MPFKFTKFSVSPSPRQGEYSLSWFGIGNGLFTFEIEWGLNEDGPWSLVKKVINVADATVELKERPLSHTDPLWFRIVAKENGKTHDITSPTFFNGTPNRMDFLRYREMIRRWNIELQKFSGSEGILLRLKTFGESADNVHPILGSPIGTEDESGLGKKFKGAYWAPVNMYAAYTDSPPTTTKQLPVAETGLNDQDAVLFLTMPFPVIKPKDIWVSPIGNSRYEIQKVEEIEFRRLTIKQQVLASRLPITDPVYKIKL